MNARRGAQRVDADRARRLEDERAAVAKACGELAALWPQLAVHALARDTVGYSDDGRKATGGSKGSASLINLDVLRAQHRVEALAYDARIIGPRAGFTAPHGEVWQVWTLRQAPAWHRAAQKTNARSARRFAAHAEQILDQAREALGLRTHDRDAGYRCPDHRDLAPTGLIIAGDEARLHEAIVGGRAPALLRFKRGAIAWTHSDTVRCPRCKREWSGGQPLAILRAQLVDLGDLADDDTTTTEGAPTMNDQLDRGTDRSTDLHDLPPTYSDERMHVIARDCWCDPELVAIYAGTEFDHVDVKHRGRRLPAVPARP